MTEKLLLTIAAVFLILNTITFLIYGIDKWKAKRNLWRIPESVLLSLAAIGGSLGALLAMKFFHHKTRHARFRYGVPVIILLQVIILVSVYTIMLD
ncbi:MAG: DUF1294 domain-containing protein [Bacteroidales bacterium]|nr:DUF1294 domain-containing protein [Bacteroidales bacterium]